MTANLQQIIIFTRYPEPGKAKTRLIPLLGPEGTADLHRRMTERTLSRVREFGNHRPVSIQVCYAGGSKALMQDWLGEEIGYCRQPDGDLGVRMAHAFETAFQSGIAQAILIGTDCPGISAGIMDRAFAALQGHDLVLGPARDGGYYLIGLKRPVPQLFTGIRWGTESVRRETLHIAEGLGLRTFLVDMLDDVDGPEDLHIWDKYAE